MGYSIPKEIQILPSILPSIVYLETVSLLYLQFRDFFPIKTSHSWSPEHLPSFTKAITFWGLDGIMRIFIITDKYFSEIFSFVQVYKLHVLN